MRSEDQRHELGTYLGGRVPVEHVHWVTALFTSAVLGVSVSVFVCASVGSSDVALVVTVMTPLAPTSRLATYLVAWVTQPAAVMSPGKEPLFAAYSATEVLHAAADANPSEIFARTV